MLYTIGIITQLSFIYGIIKIKKVQCHVEPGIRLYDPPEC